MKKNSVKDTRRFKLEEVLKKDFIPFLSGRPKRETVINKDDLLNLKILINTAKTVDLLIKSI